MATVYHPRQEVVNVQRREILDGLNGKRRTELSSKVVQLGLFERDGRLPLVVAGLAASIKAAMNRAADRSSWSREQIVERMNSIAHSAGVRLTRGNAKSISPATLEKWLNPAEREHAPSLLAVNVFCLALGDPEPLAVQIQAHGCEVMTPEDRSLLEYGKACVRERQARRTKKKIEEELPWSI